MIKLFTQKLVTKDNVSRKKLRISLQTYNFNDGQKNTEDKKVSSEKNHDEESNNLEVKRCRSVIAQNYRSDKHKVNEVWSST